MSEPSSSISKPIFAPKDESDSSLTLSITPPLSEVQHKQDETSTISEHLSSIENDRSIEEVDVSFPENFSLFDLPQERKPLSPNSSSIISLNGLENFIHLNMDGVNSAQSIMEEILNNEQFKSDSESREMSFNMFANVDLDDKLLNSYNCVKSAHFNLSKNDSINSFDEMCKRVSDFEELLAIKDTTIAALTSELDSYRELVSNTSTNSLGTSTTEYKQFQEECNNKLSEYHNAILHKDEQIEKLANSLQQCILNREEIKQQLTKELTQLQEQLQKTNELVKQRIPKFDFEDACKNFENLLTPEQLTSFNAVKVAFNDFIGLKRGEVENELRKELKRDSDAECDISELKQELDAKHSKEMEELRTYFEKKCADLEKNYSEEVFSQQSRKMSTSSSCSEISPDFDFHQPGPGGDTKVEYTKKDVIKLRQALTQMSNLIDKFNLNELDDEQFDNLKTEIVKFDVKNLIKYDLGAIRNEMLNKYNAELEFLREDFDNRVDEMNIQNEEKLKKLERKYLEEIDDLNGQLRGRIVSTAQQEVANSGEFEIDEVVQSYERRLHQQVTLAKRDILLALEIQIQTLVSNESIDDDWPEDLLQLKSRFAEKYENELHLIKELHSNEIIKLKEEHSRNLERARRRSLRDADSLSKGEIELLKERDTLKRQTLSLKNLLGELIKYFTQCEDELNNTLVEELVTKNLEKDLDISSGSDTLRRVHITPNFDELISLIDNSSENDLDSIDLKTELGSCLEKLKSDANAILAVSTSFTNSEPPRSNNLKESEVTCLKKKLITETQTKNEILEQLNECKSVIHSLETDRTTIENQFEQLIEQQKIVEGDLLKAREKIAELIESGHREIISEGYGEKGESVGGLVEAIGTLRKLQEKVRELCEKPGVLEPNVLSLIEDLSRAGSKIDEEAKKEKDDYKQQIEAADKKYKVTCQFLDEQAAEREQERDEAQKEINLLKEQIREREKDRASCERITSEIEHLEQQLREMSVQILVTEKRCKEVERERKEAVDKIFELRDIIRDLEDQLKNKTNAEDELRNIVNELEVLVKQEGYKNNVVVGDKDVSDVEKLHQYVGNLESEVQNLRLSSEIAGSEGTLQQIKNHLYDFETTLDKRTKDLEGLHSTTSTTTCSSPSEDMSIRDVVHQEKSIFDECEVPLQQLARLKEKLTRHSRAEDAAVKRMRDLELQILGLKRDLEESQNEREILKRQISDHLVLISNLQIRLDEQRLRAEHIEKQTNTSLEVQNYDLKNAITTLEEKLTKRDKTIAQLRMNIEETKKRLEKAEEDLATNKDDEIIVQMQEQLEFLRSENLKLKSKQDVQILPNFVENIITDKNNDIEKLRQKLEDVEYQLEEYSSLNLQQKEIDSLKELRVSGISLSEVVDLENFEQIRKAKVSSDSVQISPIKRKNQKTVFLNESEVSSIEKTGPPNHFSSLQHVKANSTEKHVRFEDEIEMKKLQILLKDKEEKIEDYERRLQLVEELQTKIDKLQTILDQTEENLKKATETFEKEQKENEEKIKDLRLTLASQRCELNEKNDGLHNALKFKEDELKSHEETLKIQHEEIRKKEEQISILKKNLEEVRKDLHHLQHVLCEKDKVIAQMEVDSKTLKTNLETIQNKLKETGNVVDLSRRLREEQKKNSGLYEEIHELKAQLLGLDARRSLEDIAGQVQRELDYSAYLDSAIINACSDGSSENEDLDSLRLYLKKQKAVNKQLVRAKELVEKKFEELEEKYKILKIEHDRVQLEDANLIGQLTSKLQHAVHNQVEFDQKLKSEKNGRFELETQLKMMKNKIGLMKCHSLPVGQGDYAGLSRIISNLEEENLDLKKMLQEANRANLMSRIDGMNKLSEVAFSEVGVREKLDKVKFDLDSKTNEVAMLRKLLNETDLDRKQLLKQLEQRNTIHKTKTSPSVSDHLLSKIAELNEVVKNDREMMSVIEKLRRENKSLEERLSNLEENRNLPFDDPVSRANYLFAKYLRSESYRKALSWQKRYLVSVLDNYQIPDLDGDRVRKTKKISFKSVAMMVVSLCRMKYLVKRWHSGKRITEKRTNQLQFHLGQPVSSQIFATSTTNSSALKQAKTDLPWFGSSPPSKEPPTFKGFSAQPMGRKMDSTKSGEEATLLSPTMLSKYIDRFNQIQDRLGLGTDPPVD